jgi:hypothetical protein
VKLGKGFRSHLSKFSLINVFDAFLTGDKSWFRQLCETSSMFVSRREAAIPGAKNEMGTKKVAGAFFSPARRWWF